MILTWQVVVIKGSGGCAETTASIVERLIERPEESLTAAAWLDFKDELGLSEDALELAKIMLQSCGITETKRHKLVHVWSPDVQGTFDTVVLDAIVSFYKLNEDKRRIENERKLAKQLQPLVPPARLPHVNARGRHPDYPQRSRVPDDKVEWAVPFLEYDPVPFEHPALAKNTREPPLGGKWADPIDPVLMGPPRHLEMEVCRRPGCYIRTRAQNYESLVRACGHLAAL